MFSFYFSKIHMRKGKVGHVIEEVIWPVVPGKWTTGLLSLSFFLPFILFFFFSIHFSCPFLIFCVVLIGLCFTKVDPFEFRWNIDLKVHLLMLSMLKKLKSSNFDSH